MNTPDLKTALESFERSLVINDGVPTVFEIDQLRSTARRELAELAALRAQRDELAEALRHTLARLAAETKDVECCDLYPSTVAAMNEARALLAKLEGGGK